MERHYEHVLDEPEYLFYQDFRNLTEQAQCLYLRFSNRRGDFFRLKKVSYGEIPNVEEAKEELFHQGFISINESEDLHQFNLFTKAELVNRFDFLDRSMRKVDLLLELNEVDLSLLHQQEEIAQVLKNEEVEFIKLLFFGNRYGQMTEFVIRDVGNVKIQPLKEELFKPWFENRTEALGVLHVSHLKRAVRELLSEDLPLELYLADIPWETWLTFPASKKEAEKLLLEIAYHFEQKSNLDQALFYYHLTDKPPSKERQIRILDKLNRLEEAIALAQEVISNPGNVTSFTFASDYLRKSGVRIQRSMTERLKDAPKITISKKDNHRVEAATLAYFEENGWNGIHSENFTWRALFGLVFWDVIFDESYGSFHHPLQRQPSDIENEQFYLQRSQALEKVLRAIRSKSVMIEIIKQTAIEKEGIANRFVYWHELLVPTLQVLIQKVPLKALKNVLIEIAKNIKENSTGFPDLFIWNSKTYQFYEVKSPNDHLSAQQLFWLNFLEKEGVKVDVLRVEYEKE